MSTARLEEAGPEAPRSEGIEGLFVALESPLLGYARRLTEDAEASEDLVQEAFLRLHSQFSEVRDPRRWLFRTVHNLAINHQRRAGRTMPLHGSSEPGSAPAKEPVDLDPPPDEQLALWEGIGLVRLGLEALDARSREVVKLKFHQDLSYKEISARTGLSVGHVGYLLHYAVKTLAAELAKAGIVP